MYCYTLLPLDLHVLSLPLAFILSQDQTLHCKRVMTIALKILLEKLTVLVFNINVAKTYPRYLKYQSAVASKLSKIFIDVDSISFVLLVRFTNPVF